MSHWFIGIVIYYK